MANSTGSSAAGAASSYGGLYGAAAGAGYNIGFDVVSAILNKKPKSGGPGVYEQFPSSYPGDALQNYLSRIYAANVGGVPPSFSDYVSSGGTATFPFKDPRMTPNEAAELGFVAPQGGTVPFYQPGQGQLTQEQQLYAAGELLKQHRLRDFPFLHQQFTKHQNLFKNAQGLDTRIQRHPNAPKTADRIKRRDEMLAQYFQQTGGHSIA